MTTRMETFYKKEVTPKLMEKFGYKNPMQVPRLVKITLNMGVGEAVGNKKILEKAVADMAKIAGQKPIITFSRKAHATSTIRQNGPVGCKAQRGRKRGDKILDRVGACSL